jgi:hypothetical protein
MGGILMTEYEFKVIKTANDIEDICISYGICKILEDNEIDFRLKDNKSMYSIYTEEFNINDLEFEEIDVDDIWNFSSSANLTEKKGYINGNTGDLGLNKFLEENLVDIFNYFLTGELKQKYKSTGSVSVGNSFYGYGTRANTSPKSLTISPIVKYLSMLGWIYSCSYCKNKNVEITALLNPYNTDEIKKPFNFSYTDKETGEKKIIVQMTKSSEINMMSRLYIETLIKYKMLSNEYSDVIFMQNILSGNKPLSDKTTKIKIYDLSQQYLDDLLKKLTWSNVSEDVKDTTARYVLNLANYNSFSKLVRIYSKDDNSKINSNFKEEILNMYNQKIKNIYNNEVVNKLGSGFGRLLRDKKGFDIQVKLYTVVNEKHLFRVVRTIIDMYSRNYISKSGNNISVINDEELLSLTQLINDKHDAKICVDALLSIGKVFITKKEEN